MAEMTKVKMFFMPHIAGGHLLPMVDTARFVASHPDVEVTIITTPRNIQLFRTAIDRDREAGHDISFLLINLPKAEFGLPDDVENHLNSISAELRYKVFLALMSLKEPLLQLLRAHRPHCLVSDVLHSWTLSVAKEVGIPRISFRAVGLFPLCAGDAVKRYKPYEIVGSDTELFPLTGLPDEVYFTKSRIPDCNCDQNVSAFFDEIFRAEKQSYGVIVNSFYDLEPKYHEYAKEIIGLKNLWMVGPVSEYSNKSKIDKSERGSGENSKNVENTLLNWLNTKEKNSVLYVSFGSESNVCKDQFDEIANGLERSGHNFIWAAKPNNYQDQGDEGWFPDGFEDRIRGSNQGLIVKGWVPQLLILSHENVGVFMTHCGWNSCIEGLSNMVPMITWPQAVDQFYNESLLVDVLKVGIRVGNDECVFMSMNCKPKVTVTRDKVEMSVNRMLSSGEDVQEMRRRVEVCGDLSRKAVEKDGSSYLDVCALVEDLKSRPKSMG